MQDTAQPFQVSPAEPGDYPCIYYLALSFDFNGETLRLALSKTLRNRKTNISPDSFERILKLADDDDIQVRWRYFQKTINQAGLSLSDVMNLIASFLRPVFDGILSGNSLVIEWNAEKREWGRE
jgi:hypothetical protein